jgi:type III secretion system FlhB-like substrate exporter
MVSFAPMIDQLFRQYGLAAEYYPQQGPKIDCTVIKVTPQIQALMGSSAPQILAAESQVIAVLADVRRREVPTPKRGDTVVVLEHDDAGLTIPEQPYSVIQQPELDSEKLVWTLPLREGGR